jgi:GNAT superfamily N-acetyltransferase
MVVTREARPGEFERIAAFYRDTGYTPPINPADVIVVAEVAESKRALCGAVRVCDEHAVLVLRGMRVCEGMRRQGIGTHLLEAVEPVIGGRDCFRIPHRYLRSFYGRIGFAEIEPSEAPEFLRERWAAYGREYGLDVILMRRPGGAKVRRLQSTASASSLPSPAAH